MLLDAPRAVARAARTGNVFAITVTFGAGLLDREKPLLHPHLTMAIAGRTGDGCGAGFGAAAVTGFAGFHRGNADFGFSAARSLFQRDFQVVAQIRATIDIGLSSCAPPENVTKNVTE